MKAVVVEHRGDVGSLKDIPVPQPGAHDVLVRVVAAGVNPIDWKRRDRPDQRLPFVLGQDYRMRAPSDLAADERQAAAMSFPRG